MTRTTDDSKTRNRVLPGSANPCRPARRVGGLRFFAALAAVVLAFAASEVPGQAAPPASAAARQAETQKLIATLQSPAASQFDKVQACHQLAIIGTKEAVPALAALLADAKLAHMARYALEPMPDPAVDAALRAALGRLNGKLLVGVINSIGVRRDAKAVDALSKLLTDSDPDVAAAAAASLGRIGNAKCAKALEPALAQAPATLRPRIADACLVCAERLLAQNQRRDATAMYDLLLKTELPGHVRMAAMRGAILTRQAAGIPMLVEQIKSPDATMTAIALRVAREMPGVAVTKALAAELPNLPVEKQALLLQALGDRGDTTALPAVLAVAKSGPTRVRVEALRVLAKMGNASAVPLLLASATDPDREVAQTAQAGLAMLPGKEVDAALVASLGGGDAKVRRVAIDAAAQRHIASATPALIKAASDSDPTLRLAAIKALGETVGAGELGVLAEVLIHAPGPEELAAAQTSMQNACARIPEKAACADAIIARLPQAAPPARCALLPLLGEVGGTRALATVRSATQDANAQIKDAAIRALADWPDAAAAPDLLQIAKTTGNESQRALAFGGVARLIRESEAPAEQKLSLAAEAAPLAKNPQDKKLLLSALGEIKRVEALQLAAAYLADPELADEAGAAVVKISSGLGAGQKADLAPALNQVLKSSKAKSVLAEARKQMSRLGIPAQ